MLKTLSFPKNLILRINQNLNGNLHENFYFLTNYLKVDLWQMSNSEKSLVLVVLHHI